MMNKTIFLLFLTAAVSGCGNDKNKFSKTDIDTPAVSSAAVDVSEVVGTGIVEPESGIINLAAAAGGIIKEIYKKEGDLLRKGDPIVSLDDEIDQINVQQLKSQVLTQVSQTNLAAINLGDAKLKLENKNKFLQSSRSLLEKGAETTQNIDDLETDVKSLVLDTAKCRATLILEKHRLEELKQDMLQAEVEAGQKTFRSPFDGILLSLAVTKGSSVSQLSTYAEMAPSEPEIVKAEVDELFADRLEVGQPADIRYIGSDSVIAKGKLSFISPYLTRKSLFSEKAGDQEDRLVRMVKVSMEPPVMLILNSKVECIIRVK
jgi:multidrug resistance efflux pump